MNVIHTEGTVRKSCVYSSDYCYTQQLPNCSPSFCTCSLSTFCMLPLAAGGTLSEDKPELATLSFIPSNGCKSHLEWNHSSSPSRLRPSVIWDRVRSPTSSPTILPSSHSASSPLGPLLLEPLSKPWKLPSLKGCPLCTSGVTPLLALYSSLHHPCIYVLMNGLLRLMSVFPSTTSLERKLLEDKDLFIFILALSLTPEMASHTVGAQNLSVKRRKGGRERN